MPPKPQDPAYLRHIEYLRDLAAQDGQAFCNILDELELSDQLHFPELVKKLSALVDHCDIFRDEFAFRLDQQHI